MKEYYIQLKNYDEKFCFAFNNESIYIFRWYDSMFFRYTKKGVYMAKDMNSKFYNLPHDYKYGSSIKWEKIYNNITELDTDFIRELIYSANIKFEAMPNWCVNHIILNELNK